MSQHTTTPTRGSRADFTNFWTGSAKGDRVFKRITDAQLAAGMKVAGSWGRDDLNPDMLGDIFAAMIAAGGPKKEIKFRLPNGLPRRLILEVLRASPAKMLGVSHIRALCPDLRKTTTKRVISELVAEGVLEKDPRLSAYRIVDTEAT